MSVINNISALSKGLKASEIGELLGMAKVEGMISFAVGMPDPIIFPQQELSVVSSKIFGEQGADILQYGDIAGHQWLREKIVNLMASNYGIKTSADNILITTGSMQALDLCARLLINPGDKVIVEEPTFVDAMNTFEFAGGQVVGVACDEEGMDLGKLEAELAKGGVKAIYVILDYQNPTGLCWSKERRKDFMALVAKYDVFVLEDNPYGEIKYVDEQNMGLQSLDTKGQVIFLGSLSKTLSPGMRIGWINAAPELMKVVKLVKERLDCHSSLPDHMLAAEFMNLYSYEDHLQGIRSLYKKRLDMLVAAVNKYLPNCSYQMPKGGFFLWLKLPSGVSCMDLFQAGIEEKVCFVPGKPFYAQKNNEEYIRLNFTFINEDKIEEGIKRLGKALARFQ